MKHGKKYVEAAKLIDRSKLYEPDEAIELVKKVATAKFDETIEVHLRTGCDGRHAEQQVRGAVVLPNGTGRSVRVLVFAKGAKLDEAQAAGADFVGGEELIPKIQNEGWFEFDVVVATPDMMGVVGRLGKVLGPKGLMPNPKAGTVTMDVTNAVKDWAMDRAQNSKEWDQSIIQMIPFFRREWRQFGDKEIFKMATEFESWDIGKYTLIYRFIEKLNVSVGMSPNIHITCESCGGDMEIPVMFQSESDSNGEIQGGFKSLFVQNLSDRSDELL